MTTSTVTPEIAEFANGVRAALADLPADEVDDLTDGLEADLAESLAEDLRRTLPDPVAYAAELRAAAGLPEGRHPRVGLRASLGTMAHGWRQSRAQAVENLRANPLTAGAFDFAVALRPAWWITRAWVAYQLARSFLGYEGPFLPRDALSWLVFLLLTVVSVQWGRGRWGPGSVLMPLIVTGNVVALLLLVPMLSNVNATSYPNQYVYDAGNHSDVAGLALDGESVTNLYPYSLEGKPLAGVQLFDDRGRPVTVGDDPESPICIDEGCSENLVRKPVTLKNGVVAWNVFPTQFIHTMLGDNGEEVRAPAQQPPAPFTDVPPVRAEERPTPEEK